VWGGRRSLRSTSSLELVAAKGLAALREEQMKG
jgi:hypothetical protein